MLQSGVHGPASIGRERTQRGQAHVQGTKVEGTIGRLFEGHMHMFIECINVDYKSTRRESYMDLQLDVKGCKDIYSSFDKYCEVEVMDGQNQYQTDQHGMQVCLIPTLRVLQGVCDEKSSVAPEYSELNVGACDDIIPGNRDTSALCHCTVAGCWPP